MTAKEFDSLIESGHKYTKVEAYLDYQFRRGSIAECAERWNWRHTSVQRFIKNTLAPKFGTENGTENGTVAKKKISKLSTSGGTANGTVFGTPDLTSGDDGKPHIFHIGIQSLGSDQIPLIDIDELTECAKTRRDHDGVELDDKEHYFVCYNCIMRSGKDGQRIEYISNPKNLKQLTYAEYVELRFERARDGEHFIQTVFSLENNKELRKKYSSLYKTLLNWLKN